MNQQAEPQPKFCMQCSKSETPANPIRSPLGPGWEICQECLVKEAGIIMKCKQDRPKLYPEIDQIEWGLYLGNEDAAMDEQVIKKYKISAINVCGSYLMTPFEGQKVEGDFQDIHYRKHEIADHYDEKIHHLFDDNCDWIEQKLAEGRNVLVHCAAGVSRSASFVIAYLMKKRDMLYPDALRYVKERRKVIRPNSGFKKQLQDYGKAIFQSKLGSQVPKQQQNLKIQSNNVPNSGIKKEEAENLKNS